MDEPIELRKARLAKFISELQTMVHGHKVSVDLRIQLQEVIIAALDELGKLDDNYV